MDTKYWLALTGTVIMYRTRVTTILLFLKQLKKTQFSGTLSVDKTTANVGENIKLTVTGQDDNGLTKIWIHYHNSWKLYSSDGTDDTKSWTFSESTPGSYVYKGYIYGKN